MNHIGSGRSPSYPTDFKRSFDENIAFFNKSLGIMERKWEWLDIFTFFELNITQMTFQCQFTAPSYAINETKIQLTYYDQAGAVKSPKMDLKDEGGFRSFIKSPSASFQRLERKETFNVLQGEQRGERSTDSDCYLFRHVIN